MEYLAVGHVTHDVYPGGTMPGGSAYYSAVTARALGICPVLWTALGSRFAHRDALEGIEVLDLPCKATTTFENRYEGGRRQQRVSGVASRLGRANLPANLLSAKVVHLCPVMDEVELAMAAAFPEAIVGIGVQGWVRRLGPGGLVEPKRWERVEPWLAHVDLAVLSELEAGLQDDLVQMLCDHVPMVALTHGERGSTLYLRGKAHFVDAVKVKEVDPTGAGDVYTAAMLVRLAAGDAPLTAARFASEAAAAIVEAPGASGAAGIGGLVLG